MPRLSPFWTLQVAGWSVFGVLWYIASFPIYEEMEVSPWQALARVTIYVGMGVAITMTYRPLYSSLWNRRTGLPLFAGVALVCSLAGSFVWGMAFEYFKWPIEEEPFDAKPFVQYMRTFVLTAFLLFAWSLIYFVILTREALRLETERALKAESLAHRAQLETLRYQLNPHFLFNALNSIRALVTEDPRIARDMVTGLSEYLRYSLLSDDQYTTLRQEVDVIQRYLAIEKIRFEDRLEVRCEVPAELADLRIPALLLHPLVENALKYGMSATSDPLRIRIEAEKRGRDLFVRVANTGQLSAGDGAPMNGAGIGLKNVRERLVQIYPARHAFSLDERGGWVVAEIKIEGIEFAVEHA